MSMASPCFRALLALVMLFAAGRLRAQAVEPGVAQAQLHATRENFVGLIKQGTLVGFDEALGVVTFRPLKPPDTLHQPGLMEDEVIASALRAAVVGNGLLRGLKVKVECQAGALQVSAGASATALQTAELIQLALNEDGVRQVRAGLPTSLKMTPAS